MPGYSKFVPVVKFEYVKIDLINNCGEVNLLDAKTNDLIMNVFVNLRNNEIKTDGSLENYDIDEKSTLYSVKESIAYYIENKITNTLVILKKWELISSKDKLLFC